MAKPFIHAKSSAKKYGGIPEDYLDIHQLLDSSKSVMCDYRHRALTHNSWFISVIIEKVFGVNLTNSDGKLVSTRDVAELHVAEDFGMRFIPSPQDYLSQIEPSLWMDAGKGEMPPSAVKLQPKKGVVRKIVFTAASDKE